MFEQPGNNFLNRLLSKKLPIVDLENLLSRQLHKLDFPFSITNHFKDDSDMLLVTYLDLRQKIVQRNSYSKEFYFQKNMIFYDIPKFRLAHYDPTCPYDKWDLNSLRQSSCLFIMADNLFIINENIYKLKFLLQENFPPILIMINDDKFGNSFIQELHKIDCNIVAVMSGNFDQQKFYFNPNFEDRINNEEKNLLKIFEALIKIRKKLTNPQLETITGQEPCLTIKAK